MTSSREASSARVRTLARLFALIVPMILVNLPRASWGAPDPDGPARESDPKRVVVSGLAEPNLEKIDVEMREFVARNRVPGMSVAITFQRRLLYARGFGYADLESREPVHPNSLFRIASLSKPLTAVAVLQLVERGKLKLEDRMVDVLGLKPTSDPRLGKVTIRHLLQHRGGWDRDKSYDPMLIHGRIAEDLKIKMPANQAQIIQYMMKQPLDFEPGERHAYSNFGYCVLGRVIEKLSGQTYEAYVRQHVLAPIGIRDMRLGRTVTEQRAPGEVHYYDEQNRTGRGIVGSSLGREVPLPYGIFAIEAMDAHGGWIGSAVDMVRFCCSLDDARTAKVLRAESVVTMLRRPPGSAGYTRTQAGSQPLDVYYGCGWKVRPVDQATANIWHTGALDGTSTLMVHRNDGFDWVVLCNTRSSPDGKELSGLLEPLMHKVVDGVHLWPRGNLFQKMLEQGNSAAKQKKP